MTTRTIRARTAALALAITLAARSAPTQPFLDDARTMCAIGRSDYCRLVPIFQAKVRESVLVPDQ